MSYSIASCCYIGLRGVDWALRAKIQACIYIYIYCLGFARKPRYRHIYMYMGHIRPIQALHTYIRMPYICFLPSFACEYALCHLHIPFWHVAGLSSYITLSYLNHSVPLVILILKIIFRLGTELKSAKYAPILWWNHGGTPLYTSSG